MGGKVVLYESDRSKARKAGYRYCFEPVSFEKLAWLLDFMLHDEREDERETRITALLAGEVIGTNLSEYKLVKM